MNKTATRALRATAAFAGLATAFGVSGTALASAPAQHTPSQLPAAMSNAGASTAGFTAPTTHTSPEQLHSFALPRAVPSDRHDDSDSDADGLPSPEHASSSDKYSKHNDRKHYVDSSRDDENQLRKAEANHKIGPAKCSSDPGRSGGYGYGYNGDPGREDPSSDDYSPDCTGYHADKGANRYDNENYYGTEPGRRTGKADLVGGLI